MNIDPAIILAIISEYAKLVTDLQAENHELVERIREMENDKR